MTRSWEEVRSERPAMASDSPGVIAAKEELAQAEAAYVSDAVPCGACDCDRDAVAVAYTYVGTGGRIKIRRDLLEQLQARMPGPFGPLDTAAMADARCMDHLLDEVQHTVEHR